MDKITEALKKILPAEHVNEVAKAVESVMAEQYSHLEAEFQNKLDEAYEQLTGERQNDEQIAEAGYKQAYEIISHLMNRLDEQRSEFETALEEGFETAYAEMESIKSAKGKEELELYEEFDNKLKEMKETFTDKLDQFLSLQEAEIYESAKKDILCDPRILEQRVAVEKMAEILSDYISSDDLASVNSGKIEEAQRQIEALRGQIRLLEAKNVKLSVNNTKLAEKVDEAKQYITEATKVERKERANKRVNASGRGQRVVNEQIINEFVAPTKSNNEQELVEANDPLNDILVLSGIVENR